LGCVLGVAGKGKCNYRRKVIYKNKVIRKCKRNKYRKKVKVMTKGSV